MRRVKHLRDFQAQISARVQAAPVPRRPFAVHRASPHLQALTAALGTWHGLTLPALFNVVDWQEGGHQYPQVISPQGAISSTLSKSPCKVIKPRSPNPSTQHQFTVGPALQTLTQQWAGVGSDPRVGWGIHVCGHGQTLLTSCQRQYLQVSGHPLRKLENPPLPHHLHHSGGVLVSEG